MTLKLEDAQVACGLNPSHLISTTPSGPLLHEAAFAAWLFLQERAGSEGFALKIESGWRSFDKQLSIWNRKACGELPLLDPTGKKIDALQLNPTERMWAILHWSALPGTSRHHFGSDLDVSDAKAIPPGYEVQLTPQEVAPNGIFGHLHSWLDQVIAEGNSFGFFRPFVTGKGSIQPERWHLSHAPTARTIERKFDPQILRALLCEHKIELLDEIFKHWNMILAQYCFAYYQDPPSTGIIDV